MHAMVGGILRFPFVPAGKKLTETEKPVIYTALLFKKSSYV